MIHGGMVGTYEPYNGLPANVVNVPGQWVGYPKASASNVIATKTQQTQGSSMAAGTAIDYARNLNVVLTPTASSGGATGGGVTVFGRDVYGSTRSEYFPATGIRSHANGVSGSVNFASIQTVSMKISFHSNTSSAASDYGVYVGVAGKIGLPVSLVSSDGVFAVFQGTLQKLTSSGASSTNNEYTVSTGDYWKNGVVLAHNAASLLQIGYCNLGRRGAQYVR